MHRWATPFTTGRKYDNSKGNVTFIPKLSAPDPCAPIPEVATIVLFTVGLVVLAGYLRIRRKD